MVLKAVDAPRQGDGAKREHAVFRRTTGSEELAKGGTHDPEVLGDSNVGEFNFEYTACMQ